MKTFFQILEYRFLVENTKIANAMFPYKIPSHKSMFRQIEWVEQIGPIMRNDVLLPVTSLLSWKFYFGLKTFYKKSVWCTNYSNFQIHTFWKHCNSIWGYFFPLSILNSKVFQRCLNVVYNVFTLGNVKLILR